MEFKIIDGKDNKEVLLDGKSIKSRLASITVEMKPQEPTKVTLVYYPKKTDLLTFISEKDVNVNFE